MILASGKTYSVSILDTTRGDLVAGPVTRGNENAVLWRGKALSLCAALTQDGRKVAFVGKDHRIMVFGVVHDTIKGISLQIPLVLAGHS